MTFGDISGKFRKRKGLLAKPLFSLVNKSPFKKAARVALLGAAIIQSTRHESAADCRMQKALVNLFRFVANFSLVIDCCTVLISL